MRTRVGIYLFVVGRREKKVGAIQAMVLYTHRSYVQSLYILIAKKKHKKRRRRYVCCNRNGHKENIEKYINLDLCELKFGLE